MTLILENGSGVFGANAYVDGAYVTAYLTDRRRSTENGWSTAGAAAQDAAAILGTDHVERRFRELFRGSKQWKNISTARATWTPTAQPLDTETVTLGSTVYRFVTTLATTNDVLIGTTLSGSIDNLVDAILANASTAGTAFDATTVANPDATAVQFIDDSMLALASASGTDGNGVATTTTVTGATWNFATLVGGSDVARPQPLSFPRIGLYDRDGVAIYGLPDLLKFATSEYAVRSRASSLAPDPTVDALGGIVTGLRERVGPLETETQYLPGSAGSGALPAYPAADRLLRAFLRPAGVIR